VAVDGWRGEKERTLHGGPVHDVAGFQPASSLVPSYALPIGTCQKLVFVRAGPSSSAVAAVRCAPLLSAPLRYLASSHSGQLAPMEMPALSDRTLPLFDLAADLWLDCLSLSSTAHTLITWRALFWLAIDMLVRVKGTKLAETKKPFPGVRFCLEGG